MKMLLLGGAIGCSIIGVWVSCNIVLDISQHRDYFSHAGNWFLFLILAAYILLAFVPMTMLVVDGDWKKQFSLGRFIVMASEFYVIGILLFKQFLGYLWN
jgi:hypothetical protein